MFGDFGNETKLLLVLQHRFTTRSQFLNHTLAVSSDCRVVCAHVVHSHANTHGNITHVLHTVDRHAAAQVPL